LFTAQPHRFTTERRRHAQGENGAASAASLPAKGNESLYHGRVHRTSEIQHALSSVPSVISSLSSSILLACASGLFLPTSAAAQPAGEPVIYLNQAWPQADRDWYYHFSQGAAIISYDIFLNLEVAGSQELFRSDTNSERYGLITDAANPQSNPDGLPIGLGKTEIADSRWKGEETGTFVGINCAACHEEQLNYQGKHVRIDGGVGNTFDFMSYVFALDDAMQATLNDAAKFDRLAARLGHLSPEAKGKLRTRFERETAKVHDYRIRNLVTPLTWGPSRIDAIALIVNRMTATQPGIPENWSTPLAPTKPPSSGTRRKRGGRNGAPSSRIRSNAT
jgi:hypothetical protein